MKTRIILILYFAVCIAAGIDLPKDKPDEEIFYEDFFHGSKVTYSRERFFKLDRKKPPRLVFVEDEVTKTNYDGLVTTMKSRTKVVTDPDFRPVAVKSVSEDEGQIIESSAVFGPDEIRVKVKCGESVDEYHVPVKDKKLVYPDSRYLAGLNLEKNAKTRSWFFSFSTKSLEWRDSENMGETTVTVNKKTYQVKKYRHIDSVSPDDESFSYITKDGLLVKTINENTVRAVSDKTRAKKFEKIKTFSSYIPIQVSLPLSEKTEQLEMLVKIRGYRPKNILAENRYQEIESFKSRPGWAKVTLREIRPGSGSENPDDFSRYLKPTLQLEVNHKEIRDAAEKIKGDETNPEKLARKILAWTAANLKKEDTRTGELTALETLRAGGGDCTEHSAVYVALARAMKIPARQYSGLILAEGQFGYHRWAEVWLGKWVPVDPVFNRFGVPAFYLALGEHDEEKLSVQALLLTEKLFHRSTFFPKSLVRNGKKIPVTDYHKLDEIKGRYFENGYWGYSFEIPKDIGEKISFDTDYPGVKVRIGKSLGFAVSAAPHGGNFTEKEARGILRSLSANIPGRTAGTGTVTFSDQKAYTLNLDVVSEKQKRKFLLFKNDGRVFLLIFSAPENAFDKYKPSLQKILESFRLDI